ncbi:MAG: penicillin-binding protein 2 [Desulfobacterales bacterium]
MKTGGTENIVGRTITIGIFFSLLLAVIGAKAAYLQIYRGDWLAKAAARQYKRSVVTPEKRGTIYDTKHREMAVSIDMMSIAAFPQQIDDIHDASQKLTQRLKLNDGVLFKQMLSDRKFVWVKRHVTPREVESVRGLSPEGITFITEHSRFYPNKMLASQLLGFTGVDGDGLEGIEYYFDRYLRGETGKRTVIKDARGRGFGLATTGDPGARGHDLILTIDQTIQYIVEKELAAAVGDVSAKSGMVVVMDPQTGAILALANYPYFNPNAFGEYRRDVWRNRIITDPFEPGSTMKIFTAAAALASGLVDSDTLFFTENGEYSIGENIIHDSHPHGWLTLDEIVKLSSNIGAAKISETIGSESLYRTLTDFGFRQKTGIDCPGETAGALLPHHRWSKLDAAAIAFGQGISVSAIQLVRAVAAIANGGTLMRPYVVQAVLDSNGGLVKRFGPEKIRQALSPELAARIRSMMESVVDVGGTGVRAALDGYSSGGKTGTAQKADKRGGYAENKYIASFVGFAPAKRPEIAILVVIDEPQEQYYGGTVAAPVFKQIALKTLDYLNIPPRREKEQLTVSLGLGATG